MRPFVILGLVTLVAAACEDTTSPTPSGAPGSGGRIAANRVLDGTQGFDFTTIDVPGAEFTLGRAVNSSGAIVGIFGSNGQHGFLMNASNLTNFTTIDFPDAFFFTRLTSINDAGDIVGWYLDASDGGHGFVLSGGRFTSLDVPGAPHTEAWGINNVGQIVGYDLRGSIRSLTEPGFPAPVAEAHGFLLSGGPLIPVNISGVGGGVNTSVMGINSTGVIVGGDGGTPNVGHAFVGPPRVGP